MPIVRPRPVRWLRANPRQADWLLAIALSSISTFFHIVGTESLSPSPERDPAWWSIPLSVLCVLPIALRRTRPHEVAVIVTVAQLLFTAADFNGPNFIGVLVALYSLGAHANGQRRTAVVAGIAIGVGLLFIAGMLLDELVVADFLSSTIVLATAFVLGDNLRRRRDAATAMSERAERAERERDLIAHQRVAAERARIARELHDVVAHSVSAMVIQATAARRSLERSPEQAAEALDHIETVGRRAMGELRSTLGVLRASSTLPGDSDVALSDATRREAAVPQPTLDDISSLVAEAIDLPITAHVADEFGAVPAAVGLVGYRLVQEALTNVRRHGGEVDHVEVSVQRHGDTIHLEVVDDGRGLAADDTEIPGFGVQGMHERVAAIGGFVTAEHRVGGGWQVYAELPVERQQRTPVGVDPARLDSSALDSSALDSSALDSRVG